MFGTIRPAKALKTPNVGGSVVKTKVKPAADVGADREIVLADPLFILGPSFDSDYRRRAIYTPTTPAFFVLLV